MAGDPFDRIVFDTPSVRIGAFRCPAHHPSFSNTGPARNFCFVFPRTAVRIQHEHQRAFVANPNIVTFYNRHQEYRRAAIASEGDLCDWFGLHPDIVRDATRAIDPSVDNRPERPFRHTRGFAGASTYLAQRRLFEAVTSDAPPHPLGVEERVVWLLECVFRPAPPPPVSPRQREAVDHVEVLLSEGWNQGLRLADLAREADMSVYHLCRTFRCVTGATIHQYRCRLQLRASLEPVRETSARLVDIALHAGFSSHSHFTAAFHREFGLSPSAARKNRARF